MIKNFRLLNSNSESYEVVSINIENGNFEKFNYSTTIHKGAKYLLKWGFWNTNAVDLGYKKPKDYLKRAKELGYEEFEINTLDSIPIWDANLLKESV